MDPCADESLAEGLRAGRVEAWQALYDAYAQRVWRSVARAMPGRAADVPDVVQDTMMAAAKAARSYDPSRASIWLWLSGIARNHVALYYRKQSQQARLKTASAALAIGNGQMGHLLENREPSPEEVFSRREVAVVVRSVLTELPADYETLLTARYLEDISVEDLAGLEQSTAVAVRSKLARARRAFREAYEKVMQNAR